MQHIESSKLFTLGTAADAASIKYSLVQRMRGAFHVETVGEGDEIFMLAAAGRHTPYNCSLNVLLKSDGQRGRIIIDGTVGVNAFTKVFYVLGFLILLVLGLFPGTIKTGGAGSAMDVLVFLFLGIFVIYDVNKKLAEPQALIDRVLNAVATEFGA